jgi:hypothetical protein
MIFLDLYFVPNRGKQKVILYEIIYSTYLFILKKFVEGFKFVTFTAQSKDIYNSIEYHSVCPSCGSGGVPISDT